MPGINTNSDYASSSTSKAHSDNLDLQINTHEKRYDTFLKINKLLLNFKKTYGFDDETCGAFKRLAENLMECKVVNTVCPLYIARKIDIVALYENALKNKMDVKKHSKFTGISIKHKYGDFLFTAIYFKSGNINLVGMRTDDPSKIDEIIQFLRKNLSILINESIPESIDLKRKIANRVISSKIPSIIKLDHLHLLSKTSYWRYTKYHDAIFPGAILRNNLNKVTCLFFKSGAIILTGIINSKVLYETIIILIERLAQYLYIRNNYVGAPKI